MVCSRTLYNWVWANLLPLKVMDLPDALRRKVSKSKPHAHKKKYGRSISDRPSVAGLRIEEGHWEGDAVVGKRSGKEAVILTLLEKKTENCLPLRIRNRTSQAVMEAMWALRAEFGDNFSRVFQTITVDNGGEFADSAKVEEWSTQVFFAHPCTSWESAQNERHNGLFRAFFPKACLLRSTVRKMSAPPLMNSMDGHAVSSAAAPLRNSLRRFWRPFLRSDYRPCGPCCLGVFNLLLQFAKWL